MPAYAINVIDREGRPRSFREAAPDERSLREALRARGFWPVAVAPARPPGKRAGLQLPPAEFVGMLHQLELQLRAGVNADAALGQLAEDAPEGPMRTILEHIHAEVAQGSPIHAACRQFPRQFPSHLAAVIAAGEASAQLPEAIRSLAAHVTNGTELRRTARRALIYPGIVFIATTGLVVFLLGGVVPQFAAIFTSLNVKLPAITVALIAASTFVRDHWMALAMGAAGTAVLATFFLRAGRCRPVRDRLLLGVPLLGDVLCHLATARFAAHCRLLHEAGVPLLEALVTGAELTGNAVLAGQVLRAREKVALGSPLYVSLPRDHGFPAFFVPALKSGEITGQLAAALRHIEEYAAARAKERLATALALLEPLLLATLTAVVGGIALSFFLPLFSLLAGLNTH